MSVSRTAHQKNGNIEQKLTDLTLFLLPSCSTIGVYFEMCNRLL